MISQTLKDHIKLGSQSSALSDNRNVFLARQHTIIIINKTAHFSYSTFWLNEKTAVPDPRDGKQDEHTMITFGHHYY